MTAVDQVARSTFELYRQLAEDRPAKARRYRESITDTLGHPNIHPIERARLEDALAGIAAGLPDTCKSCGREISTPESVARGRGPVCAHKAERAS